MEKKNLKINLLLGSTAALVLTPIAIIGCTKNESPNFTNNLNEEIARINNDLKLELKNNQLTNQEIAEALQNPLSFLENKIKGWIPNPNFSYTPTIVHSTNEKKLVLKIEVSTKTEPIEKVISKEFIFFYTEKNNLDQEINRINTSMIRLYKESFTIEEINSINQSNIKDFLTGFDFQNDIFAYNIIDFQKNVSDFVFKFSVHLLNKPNENKISNEIQASFKIISSNPEQNLVLDQEINRLNSSSLSLFSNQINTMQYSQIMEHNITDFLAGYVFNPEKFGYQATGFQKNANTIRFKLVVFNWANPEVKKISNEFNLSFTVQQQTSSGAADVQAEIERLNKSFNPTATTVSLTFKEFININIYNIWTKIKGSDVFDPSKFKYEFLNFAKSKTIGNPNQVELSVNLRVLKDGEKPDNNNNFTYNKKIFFNLKPTEQEEHQLNTTYFKNNATPYNDGRYNLAKYGSGTGKDSIVHPDSSPKTEPSQGVPFNAKQIKRFVYSDAEVRQLKNTFSLAFADYSGAVTKGTGWILDYKLEENGKYPTTWYIATNVHVIQYLKVPNDFLYPERYSQEYPNSDFANTRHLIIRAVKNPQKGVEIPTIDTAFETDSVAVARIEPNNVKTMYLGTDYLYTSPKDFSKDGKWQNSEEYADFAVMEVKFQDEAEARNITQNYVEETDRHFKYKKSSLLKDGVKKNNYSIIGFPDAEKSTHSMRSELYTTRAADDKNQPIDKNYDNLQNLATSVWYKMFENQDASIFDGALGLSFFGSEYRLGYELRDFYNTWGLVYPVDYGNFGAGASGSMMMDKDGNTVGILFAADPDASMGFGQALYCEGFNYQGRFGSYNLEGYDLIAGGFPNQKSSYKDNLRKVYGNSYRTKLFPNGL